MKVGIVGAGQVGSTAAFAMVLRGACNELVIIDAKEELADAQAQDLLHATPFAGTVQIAAGGYADLAGADVVVLAAGVAQKPGETRLELLGRNIEVFRDIVPPVLRAAPDAILLVATNPVDVMTYAALRISGLAPDRVIGSGTILDTARLRTLVAAELGIAPRSVHGYVVGEHGDSEVVCWSTVMVGSSSLAHFSSMLGHPLDDDSRRRIEDQVRGAADRIIAGKGATWFGIGAALARIVQAIGSDERAVLTVSGETPELGALALSLPRIVGRSGAGPGILPVLEEGERKALARSAEVIGSAIASLGI